MSYELLNEENRFTLVIILRLLLCGIVFHIHDRHGTIQRESNFEVGRISCLN